MQWIRFHDGTQEGFGKLNEGRIDCHDGELLGAKHANGRSVALAAVKVLPPVQPGKIVALWNNFHALAAKLGQAIPAEPLWFIKSSSSVIAHGDTIRTPQGYSGKIVYEGELGIVIGTRTRHVSEADAAAHIFGLTCVNDVTAVDILNRDASFAQWSRAKSFDTFGPIGPVIATDLDAQTLVVRTILDDTERQNYPVADMIFSPHKLVSLISRDVTLEPGDIISCGTSIGVGSMKPGSEVRIEIDGIGSLANRFE